MTICQSYETTLSAVIKYINLHILKSFVESWVFIQYQSLIHAVALIIWIERTIHFNTLKE